MKRFLFGFILGVALLAGGYFYLRPDAKLHVDIGYLLDQDTLFLRDGSLMYGRILREDNKNILVETKSGTFVLDRSQCKFIQENTLLRYLRQLM